ncbi:MAG: hypothetical protein WCN21_13875, partial [Comamonadaceae bacterium]
MTKVTPSEIPLDQSDSSKTSWGAKLADQMYFALVNGTDADETFDAAADISQNTQTLMQSYGRGVAVRMGAGDDTVLGSAYGDNIAGGAGTNYIDGGDNYGTTPNGSKAFDVLDVYVPSGATPENTATAVAAVTVIPLDGSSTDATDKAAKGAGYTFKVVAGSETDYIKGIEQINVRLADNSSSFVKSIGLTCSVNEAKVSDQNSYHLAWVNGTGGDDTINLSFDATGPNVGVNALLSSDVTALMLANHHGAWVDGGAGNDTITGTAFSDNFRNGAGNSKIDGGDNVAPDGQRGQDTFEIQVASVDAMNKVVVSPVAPGDDAGAGYTWMVTYDGTTNTGAGHQVDYLKNIEGISINETATNTGKWIPLVVNVGEVQLAATQPDPQHPTLMQQGNTTVPLANQMNFAWANGTTGNDSFSVASDVSTTTQALMVANQRGVYVDLGAGNDTATGSAYGDNFSMGSGVNYVDGGDNLGTSPWGGKAQDALDIYVPAGTTSALTVTAVAAVTVIPLDGSSTDATDKAAKGAGYTFKVVNPAGNEVDYIKGIERINVQVWDDKNHDGQRYYSNDSSNEVTFGSNIQLAVGVNEAKVSDQNSYHLAWVN